MIGIIGFNFSKIEAERLEIKIKTDTAIKRMPIISCLNLEETDFSFMSRSVGFLPPFCFLGGILIKVYHRLTVRRQRRHAGPGRYHKTGFL